MGAVHNLDLTATVTHLVVGNTATPKYRYVAKERPDIKVLHPNWVEAVRGLWMAGDELDLEVLEAKHRLPIFHGLEICITGFDNAEDREQLQNKVVEEGAKYHGDLTRIVTHLVAARAEGKKFDAARSWGLQVVSVKWYLESLARGMALDETLYNPAHPLEEQGIGAFRMRPRRTTLGKHARDSGGDGAADVSKKKLRRTTSTKLESQSQDMWQDISAHSIKREAAENDQWTDNDEHATTAPTHGELDTHKPAMEQPTAPADEPQSLFTGIHIAIYGFNEQRTKTLQTFLEPNGAHVVGVPAALEDASSNPFFKQRVLLVPHDRSNLKIDLADLPAGTVVATEWWVERCIYHRKVLDPSQDVLSRPLGFADTSKFSGISISSTGFDGMELREVAGAVRLLGATYHEMLESTTSVFVCARPVREIRRKEKLFYAQKHAIPIVSASWLWACLDAGEKAPTEDHLAHVPLLDASEFGGEPSTSSPASSDVQRKDGKSAPKRYDIERSVVSHEDINVNSRKDEHSSVRLSNTRKTQNTPSLSLRSVKTATSGRARKPQPFVHEDDDNDPSIINETILSVPAKEEPSRKISQPLQEVSPNRSPSKTPGCSNIPALAATDVQEQVDPPEKTTTPEPSSKQETIGPKASARPRPELEADINDLIRSAASRPSSASGLQKRKNRPLGRALSAMSNRSGSASNTSDRLLYSHTSDDTMEPTAEEYPSPRESFAAPPSTQLGYETADAEAHRLQMSKTFNDDEGFKRVASLGTVKDVVTAPSASVGNRVRGRHRAK